MFPTQQLFTPPSTPISFSSLGSQGISQLAEFASSMVYLMWHARKSTNSKSSTYNSELAYLMWQSRKPTGHQFNKMEQYSASPAFKKFCYQVLTATQLQESAVYLSLKYIAILLQSNPSIEGAEGSEYRLFIVALMLANKFLDDNTFTNKTWSDVSGMKVHDLNIMESEFLEALDYNLFVRQHEYNVWKSLLEQCRDRYQQLSFYDYNPTQKQQLVLSTLQILGIVDQQQLPPSPPVFNQFAIQPPVYGFNNHFYSPTTNLSQSSWDPLAYSLNRSCQDYYNSYYNPIARPISWKNFS